MSDRFEALRIAAKAATPGPWVHDVLDPHDFMGCGQVFTLGENVVGGNIAAPSGDLYPRSGYSPKADMEFIALAREGVPDLLAELDRTRQAFAAELIDWLNECVDCGRAHEERVDSNGYTTFASQVDGHSYSQRGRVAVFDPHVEIVDLIREWADLP